MKPRTSNIPKKKLYIGNKEYPAQSAEILSGLLPQVPHRRTAAPALGLLSRWNIHQTSNGLKCHRYCDTPVAKIYPSRSVSV